MRSLVYTSLLVICALQIISSCTSQQSHASRNLYSPKVTEATGELVKKDSTKEPKIRPEAAYNPEIISAGKPTIVFTNTNIYPAGEPKSFKETPVICIPGKDSFPAPKKLPALDSPYAAGAPETRIAKDASSKDENPQSFSSLGQLQGLKTNEVRNIMQDRSGNLWIGYALDGVTRYDGKNFSFFGPGQGFNTTIFSMLEDRSGNLWFAGSGITRYDGKNFTNFGEKEGLSDNAVFAIQEDNSGNIWFGTNGNGAIKYDGKSFTHFTDKEGLVDSFVTSITKDASGNLWFGTRKGLSMFNGNAFANFKENAALKNGFVSSMADREGNLWFGTANGGVIKYDGKLFTCFTTAEGLSGNDIRSILEDRSGNLWFGTNGSGISKFDGITFTHYTDKEGFPGSGSSSSLEDRYGNIWFTTTTAGLCKYKGELFTHFTNKEGLPNDEGVYAIGEDRSGNLWFGSDGGGVTKYDGKSFATYGVKEGLAASVISILQDTSGNMWFGTTKGFVRFDGKTFTHYLDKDGMFNSFVFSILQDKAGNIWIGTAGGGVSKFDGKSFTKYNIQQGMRDDFIKCMMQDRAGNIWFGTREGVSKYDGQTFTNFGEKEGFTDDAVRSMSLDKAGNIWFATRDGVFSYNGKYYTNFTEREGLPSNDIKSVLADGAGNIWIGGLLGLSELTKEKLALFSKKITTHTLSNNDVFFKNYGYDDGFLGMGVISNSLYEDSKGNIWVGASDRVTAWHPSSGENIADTTPMDVEVTGIRLFGENIPWMNLLKGSNTIKDTALLLSNGVNIRKFEFDSLGKWYNLPRDLSLSYNNNFLTFDFVGITMNQPAGVKYQYKLEGIDDNWSGITNKTEAPYGNLPFGNYTFKVKSMNSEGYWSKEFHYAFTIRPPWWKTWWAYTLYLLSFCVALGSFIRRRTRALREEKALLEEKMKMQLSLITERLRISRELHDDIGSTLGSISIYSEVAKLRNEKKENAEEALSKIGHTSRELIDKMSDIVWSLNPNNESFEELQNRMTAFSSMMLTPRNIVYEFSTNDETKEMKLASGQRKNIFLIFKEAIYNIAKYAESKKVNILLKVENNIFKMVITDDGQGFDSLSFGEGRGEVYNGNGIKNMRARAEEMGGKFGLVSGMNKGTTVQLDLNV